MIRRLKWKCAFKNGLVTAHAGPTSHRLANLYGNFYLCLFFHFSSYLLRVDLCTGKVSKSNGGDPSRFTGHLCIFRQHISITGKDRQAHNINLGAVIGRYHKWGDGKY